MANKSIKQVKENTMITMKTIYILTALIGMQFNTVFAETVNGEITSFGGNIPLTEYRSLMPETPKVADFSDSAPELTVSVNSLAPVTPKEATFEEISEPVIASPSELAPSLPSEADFEEAIVDTFSDTECLRPVTPATADFEA